MPHTSLLSLPCLALALASCASTKPVASVCNMRATPDAFVGVRVELSGFADVWRHGTNLKDPACPELAIALSGPPGDTEDSPSDRFFLSLAPGISPDAPDFPVTVVGKLTRRSEGFPRYVFVVESGSIRNTNGG